MTEPTLVQRLRAVQDSGQDFDGLQEAIDALDTPPVLIDGLREALAELVACKDLKEEWERLALKLAEDDRDMETFCRWDEIKGDYDHRAPLAWAAARAALSQSLPPAVGEE